MLGIVYNKAIPTVNNNLQSPVVVNLAAFLEESVLGYLY